MLLSSSNSPRFLLGNLCHWLGLLAPAGWILFLVNTRNSFQLSACSPEDLMLALVLTGAGALGALLGWCLNRRSRLWAWLPAVLGLSAAAIGWGITLGTNLGTWQAALDTGRITASQFRHLWLTALLGLLGSALALGLLLWPGKGRKADGAA